MYATHHSAPTPPPQKQKKITTTLRHSVHPPRSIRSVRVKIAGARVRRRPPKNTKKMQ